MDIFGLTDRGVSQGAYALILKEADGNRKMPIIIGIHEAHAIANELEGLHPQRPMTHDLLRMVIEGLGGQLKEVNIHSLKEGTFYASLVFDYSNLELDARPSDAIAIAIRCGAPIYVTEEILEQASLEQTDENADNDGDDQQEDEGDDPSTSEPDSNYEEFKKPITRKEKLELDLAVAIRNEDYERAARIRDELNNL